jgi:hypothetical protein
MGHDGACAEADKPLSGAFALDFKAQEVEKRTSEREQPDETESILSERHRQEFSPTGC